MYYHKLEYIVLFPLKPGLYMWLLLDCSGVWSCVLCFLVRLAHCWTIFKVQPLIFVYQCLFFSIFWFLDCFFYPYWLYLPYICFLDFLNFYNIKKLTYNRPVTLKANNLMPCDVCVPVKPSPKSRPWTYPSPPKVSSCPFLIPSCALSLKSHLHFLKYYISGIIWDVLFCVWLLFCILRFWDSSMLLRVTLVHSFCLLFFADYFLDGCTTKYLSLHQLLAIVLSL